LSDLLDTVIKLEKKIAKYRGKLTNQTQKELDLETKTEALSIHCDGMKQQLMYAIKIAKGI
jgi:hypothetical protein